MKPYTQALFDLLHGGDQYLMCDLYTVTLASGQVLRYTSADFDVSSAGQLYVRGPLIERTSTKLVIGMEVDTCTLTISADETHALEGLPFVHAVAGGALDSAHIRIDRAFFSDWQQPVVGTVNLFAGRVSTVPKIVRNQAEIELRSHLELLDTKIPTAIYEASCSRVEYSPGCGASKAAMTVSGTASSTSGTTNYLQSSLTQPDGWFDLGALTFTSGRNAGLSRTVKSYGSGLFRFSLALPHAPQAGDQFTAYPGCPKTLDACRSKFGNNKFRGFPFVPPAETAQ